MSDKKLNLYERLENYPYLKSRFKSILDIVEGAIKSVGRVMVK